MVFPVLQQGTKGGVPSETNVQEATEKSSRAFSPAEGLPAVPSRSSSSQVLLQCSPGSRNTLIVVHLLLGNVATVHREFPFILFFLFFSFFSFSFSVGRILLYPDFLFSPCSEIVKLVLGMCQDGASLSSTAQTDASSYVSGLLNSAYQRASSVRMSMPATFEVKERSAKQNNATEVTTTPNPLAKNASTPGPNSGYMPSIPYWNVFESAIQKAGHMVGAGSIGSGSVSDSSHKSSLVRSFSASNLREFAHKKSNVPSVEASDSGVSSSTRLDDSLKSNGSKQVHKFDEQRLPGSTESKLTDWLRLPSTALRSLSRREGTETGGRGDQFDRDALREQEGLEEGDKEHPGLDLEDPQVVESYARLQAEQAAKLEAWLGDSKEDETTPQS